MIRAFAIVGTLVLITLGCWIIFIMIEHKDFRKGLDYDYWDGEDKE